MKNGTQTSIDKETEVSFINSTKNKNYKLSTIKLFFKEPTVFYNNICKGHCKGQTVDNLSFRK